mmetsp:Transcript_9556/g.27357  ORF Transcript_9556/g.27357 Transcript_9556/m.27357 type:complete len:251 (-) Transcript_9556:490-1242(-)
MPSVEIRDVELLAFKVSRQLRNDILGPLSSRLQAASPSRVVLAAFWTSAAWASSGGMRVSESRGSVPTTRTSEWQLEPRIHSAVEVMPLAMAAASSPALSMSWWVPARTTHAFGERQVVASSCCAWASMDFTLWPWMPKFAQTDMPTQSDLKLVASQRCTTSSPRKTTSILDARVQSDRKSSCFSMSMDSASLPDKLISSSSSSSGPAPRFSSPSSVRRHSPASATSSEATSTSGAVETSSATCRRFASL